MYMYVIVVAFTHQLRIFLWAHKCSKMLYIVTKYILPIHSIYAWDEGVYVCYIAGNCSVLCLA